MKHLNLYALAATVSLSITCASKPQPAAQAEADKVIALPAPKTVSMPLSEVMKKRRTTRSFDGSKKATLQEISNLLFAMQGLTDGEKRAVPSPRAVYPLEVHVVATNVDGLEDGIYRMDIPGFKLQMIKKGDYSAEISDACMGQEAARSAQVRIIVSCVWEKLAKKMGEEGRKWGMFEAGAASQNGYLMAAALGLNAVPVGGMDPDKVAKVIGVDPVKQSPLIVNCFGR